MLFCLWRRPIQLDHTKYNIPSQPHLTYCLTTHYIELAVPQQIVLPQFDCTLNYTSYYHPINSENCRTTTSPIIVQLSNLSTYSKFSYSMLCNPKSLTIQSLSPSAAQPSHLPFSVAISRHPHQIIPSFITHPSSPNQSIHAKMPSPPHLYPPVNHSPNRSLKISRRCRHQQRHTNPNTR